MRKRRRIRKSIKFLLWTGICLSLIFVQTRMNGIINASEDQFFCGIAEHTHEIDCYQADEPVCQHEEHLHEENCHEQVLICTEEESEETDQAYEETGHLHSETCFESRLICESEVHEHAEHCFLSRTPLCKQEEHVHDLSCTSNPDADVESDKDWKKQLKDLPEDIREKALEIASRQIGYQESDKNFVIDERGNPKGITRYGQFASDLYGDWNLYFISYVLHYAQASVFEEITNESGTVESKDIYQKSWDEWVKYANAQKDYVKPLNHKYKEGDLVVVQIRDLSVEPNETIGIISKVNEENHTFSAIFGDFNNRVVEKEVNQNDFVIRGYIETQRNDSQDSSVPEDDSLNQSDKEDLTEEETVAGNEEEIGDGLALLRDAQTFTRLDDPETNTIYLIPEVSTIDKGNFTIDLSVYTEKTEESNLEISVITRDEAAILAVEAGLVYEENNESSDSGKNVEENQAEENNEIVKEDEENPELSEEMNEREVVFLFASVKHVEEQNPETQPLREALDEAADVKELYDQSAHQLVLFDHFYNRQDLDQIVLTGEITPTKQYVKDLEKENEVAPVNKGDNTISLMAYSQYDEEPDFVGYTSESFSNEPLLVSLDQGSLFMVRAFDANPSFTVQYFTEMDVIVTGDVGGNDNLYLPIMDTSAAANKTADGKAKLPTNRSDSSASVAGSKIYLQNINNKGDSTLNLKETYKARTIKEYIQTYEDEKMRYVNAPNVSHMEKLAQTESYELTGVWVLNAGVKLENARDSDWKKFNVDEVHFTNNDGQADSSNGKYTLISEGTVIRLIYTERNFGIVDFNADFFDYDITTDGTKSQFDGVGNGINTPTNYKTNGNQKLGVGNNSPGSGYDNAVLPGTSYYINQFNTQNKNRLHGYATFGMVERKLGDNGSLQFVSGISAPALFGQEQADGKHIYDGSLGFKRQGDTYTISTASVGGVQRLQNLDQFTFLKEDSNFKMSEDGREVNMKIISNNFWPFDQIQNTDIHYGEKTGDGEFKYLKNSNETKKYWQSDDKKGHNNLFGMEFTIDFNITEDYKGPLEYRFYGDDDLWVYLDGQLIIDIGGIHSSVGQMANLWDYLRNDDGSVKAGDHQLKIFYTERGLYGSTCFMEFTLPSASAPQPQQKTGDLRIEKQGVNIHPDEKFEFTINFKNGNDTPLVDHYNYSKFVKGKEEPEETKLIIESGATFTLTKDEYIIIQFLPVGTKYTITELEPDQFTDPFFTKTKTGTDSEYTDNSTRVVGGTITAHHTDEVYYQNLRQLVMPETGDDGSSWFFQYGAFTLLVGGVGVILALRMKEE